MAKLLPLLIGILVFQTSSKATANENKHSIINTSVNEDPTADSEQRNAVTQRTNENDASGAQRQKRFYDYLGFGLPPYNFPSAFPYQSQPHYTKRDESQNTGTYGAADALSIVYKRLHDLVRDVRQQNIPNAPKPSIPTFIPLFYVPQIDCSCSTNVQRPKPTPNKPASQPSVPASSGLKPIINSNGIPTDDNTVTIEDRFSENDGTKNSVGVSVDKIGTTEDDIEDDGRRPINLSGNDEKIEVPVPPVEHGTVQAGAENAQIPKQSGSKLPEKPVGYPPQDAVGFPPALTVDQSRDSADNFIPSLCDGAIVSCCNRPSITEKCFELLGCQNPYVYGNPCDSEVQLTVVNKFLRYQKRRTDSRKTGVV